MKTPNNPFIETDSGPDPLPFPTQYGDYAILMQINSETGHPNRWFGIPVTGIDDAEEVLVIVDSEEKRAAMQVWLRLFELCGVTVTPLTDNSGYLLRPPKSWHYLLFHEAEKRLESLPLQTLWNDFVAVAFLWMEVLTRRIIQVEGYRDESKVDFLHKLNESSI